MLVALLAEEDGRVEVLDGLPEAGHLLDHLGLGGIYPAGQEPADQVGPRLLRLAAALVAGSTHYFERFNPVAISCPCSGSRTSPGVVDAARSRSNCREASTTFAPDHDSIEHLSVLNVRRAPRCCSEVPS